MGRRARIKRAKFANQCRTGSRVPKKFVGEKSSYEKFYSNAENAIQVKKRKRRKTIPENSEECKRRSAETADERDHIDDERVHVDDERDHIDDERVHVDDERDHIDDERDHIDDERDHIDDERNRLEKQLKESNETIAKLSKKNGEMQRDLASKDEVISTLKQEVANTRSKMYYHSNRKIDRRRQSCQRHALTITECTNKINELKEVPGDDAKRERKNLAKRKKNASQSIAKFIHDATGLVDVEGDDVCNLVEPLDDADADKKTYDFEQSLYEAMATAHVNRTQSRQI